MMTSSEKTRRKLKLLAQTERIAWQEASHSNKTLLTTARQRRENKEVQTAQVEKGSAEAEQKS